MPYIVVLVDSSSSGCTSNSITIHFSCVPIRQAVHETQEFDHSIILTFRDRTDHYYLDTVLKIDLLWNLNTTQF